MDNYDSVYNFLRNKLDKGGGFWSTFRGYIDLVHIKRLSVDGIGFRLYSNGMLAFHDKRARGTLLQRELDFFIGPLTKADIRRALGRGLRRRIWRLCRRVPLTCKELEDITGGLHQTISARITELTGDHMLKDVGQRGGMNVYEAVF